MKKRLSYGTGLFLILTICTSCRSQQRHENNVAILPGAFQTAKYLPLLKDKKVGIVANHASTIANTNVVDSLIASGITVSVIFTPEHGFLGNSGAGMNVNDSLYRGIPVVSLYGEKMKPSSADLAGTDIVVFDLQDVGTRFYTYISTLTYVMEACAKSAKPMIVFDRPNPNGFYIDGPVLKPKFSSFVGLHPVPVVYGMTIGEYAKMVKGENWCKGAAKLQLKVIKCKNYTHSSLYQLPVSPSPNLPDMRAIYLYPSLCFFEGTIISVGRGTDFPFQIIGCPDYPDTSFSFTPLSIPGKSLNPPYKGQLCHGIDLRKVSIERLTEKPGIRLLYLLDMYSKLKKGESFFTTYFSLLAGTDELQKQIQDGMTADEIRRSWQNDLEKFKKIRIKYLLYPDFD